MSSSDCLFCKIAAAELPADVVYRDDAVTIFRDIHPQAPTHLLIIPNRHVASASQVADPQVFASLFSAATAIAQDHALRDYRLVINNGAGAGQSVFHLHVHLLSGRALQWPPG
ncbi:MAG: histidine triad nucleotide-binding protein [Vampirovibrionales bacterium]|nr:histidine triad nucleotide-binding protein [Vampirovibrionales bacterium]